MAEIKDILAKNLYTLRRARSLTQWELAEQLHYSDKSVSKWEHGDAVPDIEVIAALASFFGVTVDWLISEHEEGEKAAEKESAHGRGMTRNRYIVTLLSTLCVWLVATVVYVQLRIWANINYWCAFVWAVPASCVVLIVFHALWARRRFSPVLTSVLVWSLLTGIYLQCLRYNLWMFYLIGAPLQIGIILWACFRRKTPRAQ